MTTATTSVIRDAIEAAAARHGLKANLVEAVVLTESAGNPFAWNPEPKYRYLVNVLTGRPFRALTPGEIASEVPPVDFHAVHGDPDQEWWAQQASWGLMQVMGAVAREHGCRSHYLTELTDIVAGLQFGCKHLASLLTWAKGNTDQAIAAYNAGPGNWASEVGRGYVSKVRVNLAQIEGTRRA